jgi:SAM-dependent methyltransferase
MEGMTQFEIERKLEESEEFEQDSLGIWRAKVPGEKASISYPEEGNQACYEIEDDSFWFAHRRDVIRWALRIVGIPLDRTILDVGGGNGYVAKAIADDGRSVALLEPGYEGCLNAVDRDIPIVIQGTLENLKCLELGVDAASAFDVIEHIQDDAAFVDGVFRILASKGIFLLTVPALQTLWSPVDVEAGHFRRYNRSSIVGLFDRNDWEILFNGYFFTYLTMPILFFRRLNRTRRNQAGNTEAMEEHVVKSGWVRKIFIKLANRYDLFALKILRGSIPGSSIIVVARKR